MESGMLWFDNDPRSDLKQKVSRAATYFRDKYGQIPTLCHVHPEAIPEGEQEHQVGFVKILADRAMLPNYFWIGVENHDHSD